MARRCTVLCAGLALQGALAGDVTSFARWAKALLPVPHQPAPRLGLKMEGGEVGAAAGGAKQREGLGAGALILRRSNGETQGRRGCSKPVGRESPRAA